jgi:hypothetical protein
MQLATVKGPVCKVVTLLVLTRKGQAAEVKITHNLPIVIQQAPTRCVHDQCKRPQNIGD